MTAVLPAAAVAAACVLLALGAAATPFSSADAKPRACDRSLNASLKIVQPRAALVVSGEVCAKGRVRIQQRTKGSWRRIGRTRADRAGGFSACVRLRRTRRRKVLLSAVASNGTRARTMVRISAHGGTGCELHLLKEDLATDPDPRALWGSIDAVSPTRHQWFASGGPDGGPFRRITALDGDDFDGERAELGNGDYLPDSHGRLDTFYLYRGGTHRVTSFWMRLADGFPISPDRERWQNVMQMKQTSPANNSSGTPVLALQATDGDWLLKQSDSPGPADDMHILWRTPARVGVWTRIVFDAVYSNDPRVARLRITIGGVSSPLFHTYTLKTETSPPGEELRTGDPIPSHLRVGIYHDETLPSASVDITDVQIFG
ncbi:MAG TPA: heparin lyase I family protein [Solirubrobacterales bacterium]